jgi:hypothetical protein
LPAEEVGLDVLAAGDVLGEVQRVVARADRSVGNRGHVEEQAHDDRV